MNENIEELKKVNKEYIDTSAKLGIALSYIVPVLEDFEKRIKKLEQNQPYPTKQELKKMNLYEGTD